VTVAELLAGARDKVRLAFFVINPKMRKRPFLAEAIPVGCCDFS